jgi:ferric-dicitrate binding protein FerR (iron transport regulator)
VWVNLYEAKDSTAVFPGDDIETKTGFSANLTLDGTAILIQPEAVTKFQGDWLALDHGEVNVGTSTKFTVRVKCISVAPVLNERTQYEVRDVNGTVQVAALKQDVQVEIEGGHAKAPEEKTGSGGGVLHQGEQHSYSESDLCGVPGHPGAALALNPKWIGAGAAGAGVLIWLIIHGGGNNSGKPLSASDP